MYAYYSDHQNDMPVGMCPSAKKGQKLIGIQRQCMYTCKPKIAAGRASAIRVGLSLGRAASRYLSPNRPPWRTSHCCCLISWCSRASRAWAHTTGRGWMAAPTAWAAVSLTGAITCHVTQP